MNINPTEEQIESLYQKLKKEAEERGYYLNPDIAFTKELVKGLIINEQRYGYPACPCRLSKGIKEEDLDIICPCDYRDADLEEFGVCYCALYVSSEVAKGKKEVKSIKERRPPKSEREIKTSPSNFQSKETISNLKFPVYRCKVCGYLCAREDPPEICPICKARKDRFERFM